MKGPLLLVVDDSPTVRKVVELSLRPTQWEVEFASTGTEGARLAVGRRPDLILVDYVLPDMKATEMCRMLAGDSRTQDVPVILMSGSLKKVRHLFHDLSNVVDFVAKPFAPAELVHHVDDVHRQRSSARTSGSAGVEPRVSPPGDGVFGVRGQLGAWTVLDLLRVLDASERTGVLELSSEQENLRIYVRKGRVLLATAPRLSASALDELGNLPAPALQAAAQEQSSTGRPALVSLAERGLVPADRLRLALHGESLTVVLRALSPQLPRFTWTEAASLPVYVEAYGHPISAAQVPLEKLRRERPLEAADQMFRGNMVLDRAPGFSRRISRLELNPEERLVLALVDGRANVDEIIRQSVLTREQATLILYRLVVSELLRPQADPRASSAVESRAVVIFEADVEGFQRPLAEHLRARAEPLELVPAEREEEVWPTVERARPRLLIFNATHRVPQAQQLALAVRSRPDLAGLGLLAVMDTRESRVAQQLVRAGFDMVLPKPIHLSDVERWLEA